MQLLESLTSAEAPFIPLADLPSAPLAAMGFEHAAFGTSAEPVHIHMHMGIRKCMLSPSSPLSPSAAYVFSSSSCSGQGQ